MQLHERMMDLIGHEVSIACRADEGEVEIPNGVVKEVGPDFLIVGVKDGKQNADWWVRLPMVVALIHSSGCPACSDVEPVSG